ncbi:MAG: bifunctional diguanylate cyclase/phosphodiesterase [Actinobacteria bacterium]|nr:bifunctional diguanylate cyclase/phosphodiesterase [Actinomycetota bacterium]
MDIALALALVVGGLVVGAGAAVAAVAERNRAAAGRPDAGDEAASVADLAGAADLADLTGTVDGFGEALMASGPVVGRTGEHPVVPAVPVRDELTGCASADVLRREIDETLATGAPFVLLLVDLDHFTDLNAALGQHLGDRVLVAVARRLTWTLRRHDVLARLDADRFALLVRPESAQVASDRDLDVATLADDVMRVLDIPIDADGMTITARASIGVVRGVDDGTEAGVLLRRAELALRRAKRRGGSWARFDLDDETAAARRVELSTGLPVALDDCAGESDEIAIHFQPIVELATARVRSAEALIRWRHPRLGVIPPAELVRMAERDGSGIQLFRFVLGRALTQLATWRAAGLLESIAVNMSPSQLVEPDLLDVVADALVEHDVPPSALTLEITEDALLDQGTDAVPTLRRLHELGVRLAIDDFGTGYSSLAHLRLLHIDVLKLDRSFVQGGGAESRHDALVALALGTAHRLGLTVVAEGVEHASTLAMLRREGCDAAQGHHICRPGDAATISAWLGSHREGAGRLRGSVASFDPADHTR